MAAGTGSLLGGGTTFAFSSGGVGTIVSMDPEEESIAAVDDTSLATSAAQFAAQAIPGKRRETSEMSGVSVFDPDTVPALGTVVTGTLTYLPRTGQTVGAVRAGTGFLTKRKVTSIENDARILLNWSFQFDGKTGPTYTAGS